MKLKGANGVPANAVIFVAIVGAIVTLPALIKVNIGTDAAPLIIPAAFYAVTSIAVIGLYLAFAIPIWLRWRNGRRVRAGLLDQRRQVQVDEPVAVAEIVISRST